jgi:dolichol-phosphate mannosyltransferase
VRFPGPSRLPRTRAGRRAVTLLALLVVAQIAALLLLGTRLQGGRNRAPPVRPPPGGLTDTTVSVLLPALNEGRRIGPCLSGLRAQGPPLAEVIVIDSGSTDDTRSQVDAIARGDERFRIIDDRPLPTGWIGKVWALERGRAVANGEWLLGIDADTEPLPGLVAGVVSAARAHGFDIVSFSPRFAGMTPAEQWVQPALLTTLVYRTGAAGGRGARPDRVLANGQCFLARAAVLAAGTGYTPARASFSDDVTLARHYAARGYRVGFLDGSELYLVRSYESLRQMWREWGRSIGLRDATTTGGMALDVAYLTLVQALPVPVVGALASGMVSGAPNVITAAAVVNGVLLLIRVLMLVALRRSYERRRLTFWLSPLADPLAVLRVALSAVRRPSRWRGRDYPMPSSE